MTTHMQTASDSFITEYQTPVDFMNQQLKIFWTSDEIEVEKDVHDILTNMTEQERHGVFTTLKLFTHYELKAGVDYWTGRYMKSFPRHEFVGMAATFGMFELAVHKPFYNKINELLNAHDDSFYTDYIDNPVLKARMEHIDSIVNDEDDLVSLVGFCMVEGVILYSSFAFLKHFQSLGKNKLLNVVRGINMSARDETLHCDATAWTFKELLAQRKQKDIIAVTSAAHQTAMSIYKHEVEIIDMIFEKGEIEGITADSLALFVQSRVDLCLTNMGLPILFGIEYNPIAEWFYSGVKSYQFNDFFSGVGREYTRNWNQESFKWSHD